jgi:hypothetical protein
MTRNQNRAVRLAEAVLTRRVAPEALPEPAWELLLLAAGVNCIAAAAGVVARRVVANARRHVGYFAPRGGHPDRSRARSPGRPPSGPLAGPRSSPMRSSTWAV